MLTGIIRQANTIVIIAFENINKTLIKLLSILISCFLIKNVTMHQKHNVRNHKMNFEFDMMDLENNPPLWVIYLL